MLGFHFATGWCPLSLIMLVVTVSPADRAWSQRGELITQQPALGNSTIKVVNDSEPVDVETQLAEVSAIIRLRELTCARAADFQYAYHAAAAVLVVKYGYVDSRFNAPIYAAMRDTMRDGQWEYSEVSKALLLLPYCTLTEDVQVKLAYAAYMKVGEASLEFNRQRDPANANRMRRLQISLSNFMRQYPSAVASLLKRSMADGSATGESFNLIALADSKDSELVDLVIEQIQSDNPMTASGAMKAAHDLIYKKNDSDLRPVASAPLAPAPVDSPYPFMNGSPNQRSDARDKCRIFAETVMRKYDLDADGEIAKTEMVGIDKRIRLMLDSDGNNTITSQEITDFEETKFRSR